LGFIGYDFPLERKKLDNEDINLLVTVADLFGSYYANLQSRERFRMVFDSAPLGVYVARPDRQILDGNRKLLEIMGSPSLDATKEINLLTFPPLVHSGYSSLLQECAETGETRNIELLYKSKWGVERYIIAYLVPQKDILGTVNCIFTLMEDISEHKQISLELKNIKDFLDTILDRIQDGISIFTIQSVFGEKTMELSGYPILVPGAMLSIL